MVARARSTCIRASSARGFEVRSTVSPHLPVTAERAARPLCTAFFPFAAAVVPELAAHASAPFQAFLIGDARAAKLAVSAPASTFD